MVGGLACFADDARHSGLVLLVNVTYINAWESTSKFLATLLYCTLLASDVIYTWISKDK